MTHHLVVLKKKYLDRILHKTKTVECRLSRTRRPPFGRVAPRDLLWLKQSGGPIRGTARVASVDFVHPISPSKLASLRRLHHDTLEAEADFFTTRSDAKFATFVTLTNVRSIQPLSIDKKNRSAWVVLSRSPVPK